MSSIKEKHLAFTNNLISLTREDKIVWRYLDVDNSLCQSLNLTPHKSGQIFLKEISGLQEFDRSNSFYAPINKNYIVLYTIYASNKEESLLSRLKLKLVPGTYRSIEEVEAPNEIVRLQTLIKSKFPSADDIINDIENLINPK